MRRVCYAAAVVAALLVVPSESQAQTVPGSCPAGTSNAVVPSNQPLTLLWCSPSADAIVGAKVFGLPGGTLIVPNVTRVAGPYSSDGTIQYSVPLPPQVKGNYTVSVVVWNYAIPGDPNSAQQEAPASVPFALGVVDAANPPAAPTNLKITY